MKAFCENCNDFTEYEIETNVDKIGILGGKTYEYKGEEARCTICGDKVYVGEAHDRNLKRLYGELEASQGNKYGQGYEEGYEAGYNAGYKKAKAEMKNKR